MHNACVMQWCAWSNLVQFEAICRATGLLLDIARNRNSLNYKRTGGKALVRNECSKACKAVDAGSIPTPASSNAPGAQ